jgi:hypothetical protein
MSSAFPRFEVTEVCPGLLLCGATMVGRTNHPVTCIVNAAPELPDPPLADTIKTVKIHILDSATEPLDSYFDQVADLVQKVSRILWNTLIPSFRIWILVCLSTFFYNLVSSTLKKLGSLSLQGGSIASPLNFILNHSRRKRTSNEMGFLRLHRYYQCPLSVNGMVLFL